MRVGDKLTWTPSGFDHEVSGQRADKQRKLRCVTGRIVYIHPAGRYYLAEAHGGGAGLRGGFLMEKS